MVIDTIYGYNTCGPLGPTSSNAIFAFDLTDVSTLVPYAHTTETYRPYTRQLQLSDLGRDCASVSRETAVATKTWGTKSNETRCNPNLIVPAAIKRYGYPYWRHCGNVGNKFGLFDPPYAIQPVDGLFNNDPTTTSVADPVPTTSVADPVTTTSVADPVPTTSVADPVPTTEANVEPSTTPKVTQTSPDGGGSVETSSRRPDSSAIAVPTTQDTALPTDVPDVVVSTPIQTTVASPTISDVWTPPATVVTTQSGQIVSLGPSGIEIISVSDGQTLTSTYLPVGGATQGSQSIPSVVTYEGHTLTAGGAATTLPGVAVTLEILSETQVASLGPSGLEIVNVVNGQTYTSTVSPLSGTAQSVPSVVTYQGHTLTAGGAAVTVTTAISTVARGTAAVSGSVGNQTTSGSTAVSPNTTSIAPVHVVTAAAVRPIGETSSVFFGLAVVLLMM
jgi:hypothetical protein